MGSNLTKAEARLSELPSDVVLQVLIERIRAGADPVPELDRAMREIRDDRARIGLERARAV